jgi:arylsulfatase A-like enzyme
LDSGWQQVAERRWRRSLPVVLPHEIYRAAPPGLSLYRGGEPMGYDPQAEEKGARPGMWEIVGRELLITSPRDPATWQEGPPLLVHAATAAREARLEAGRSGLPPAQHVQLQATIGPLTRRSLLLAAPGSLELYLPPEGGRLRFALGLIEGPQPAVRGEAGLRVELDGQVLWTGQARTGEAWQEVELSLTAAPGTRRVLRLVSDPLGNPEADWLVVGEPELVGPASPEGPRRVVLVGVDTLRPDLLGAHGAALGTSPGLDQVAAQSLVFDRAWAPAPRTRPSFRSALTGHWPLAAIEADTIAEVLAREGFSAAGVVANVHMVPHLGMADGSSWWRYIDSARADVQVDEALRWLEAHSSEDSLLFLHIMDPHVFYEAPEPFLDLFNGGLARQDYPTRFNRFHVEDWEEQGRLSPEIKAHIRGRYLGELAWTDSQLHRLVERLDALPGQTLTIFFSDHGEELWEHGGFEHNHSLYDELVRALLWVRPPRGWRVSPARRQEPASLVDIAPTVYDWLQLPQERRPAGLAGESLLPLLREDAALVGRMQERLLPLGHMMYGREHWGVLHGRWKYVLFTMSGEELLFDLLADPGERHNLAATEPLEEHRRALSRALGWPAGQGWRVQLRHLRVELELAFEEPVRVQVIDPEAGERRRANLEWGEVPRSLARDLALVEDLGGGRRWRIHPGEEAGGTLAVLGPGPESQARLRVAGAELSLGVGLSQGQGYSLMVRPGAVVMPEDSEARRLASAGDADATAALKALGYLD